MSLLIYLICFAGVGELLFSKFIQFSAIEMVLAPVIH